MKATSHLIKVNLLPLVVFVITGSALNGQHADKPADKLKKLGLTLPASSQPIANYVKYVRQGNILYLSGHGFCGTASPVDVGKLGETLNTEQGYEAARNVGLCLLATVQDALGDLSKVKRIIKVVGLVNSTPEFKDHPKVMNGFSDLMAAVFGEEGKHVRTSVGVSSLPNGMAVEVDMILEIKVE